LGFGIWECGRRKKKAKGMGQRTDEGRRMTEDRCQRDFEVGSRNAECTKNAKGWGRVGNSEFGIEKAESLYYGF
jgi:hypothetical protein